MWGTDRYIGGPRIPTQILEAAGALALALATTAVILVGVTFPSGMLLLSGLASYVLLRQLLLPLRATSRRTVHGRLITLIVSIVATVLSLAVMVATAVLGLSA